MRPGGSLLIWVMLLSTSFTMPSGEFYDLDSLWADAPLVDWQAELGTAP